MMTIAISVRKCPFSLESTQTHGSFELRGILKFTDYWRLKKFWVEVVSYNADALT